MLWKTHKYSPYCVCVCVSVLVFCSEITTHKQTTNIKKKVKDEKDDDDDEEGPNHKLQI